MSAVAGKSGVGRGVAWMCVVLLQLLAGTGVAQAASAACEAINLIGATTSEIRSFAQGAFLPGESLTISFRDSGENIGKPPTSADAIIFRSLSFGPGGYDYRSNTGSAGAHSGTVDSSFLVANGLFMSIKTGRYISPVEINCISTATQPLQLAPPATQQFTVGTAVDVSLAASGGTLPYSFGINIGTLPAGLVLEPSGRLHGTPQVAGTFSVSVEVTDAAAASAQQPLSGNIAAIAPDAPGQVVAVAGDGQAVVSFTAPAQTGGAPIVQYAVMASTGEWVLGTQSPITVTGLANGMPVQFQVIANNGSQASQPSQASAAVTPMTGQTIQFNAPGDQPLGSLLALQATASSGLAVEYESLNPLVCVLESAGNLRLSALGTCTVRALQPGNAGTRAAQPVERSFNVVAARASAPTLRRVERIGASTVDVYFDVPASDGGSAILSYEVAARPGAAVVSGGSSPVRMSRLHAGTTYTFAVRARTATGPGTFSAESDPVTMPTVPRVTGLQVPADGRYLAGASLDFLLVLDQPAIVQGVPELLLSIGGQRVAATYRAGSGSNLLAFSYAVLPGQLDEDGIGIDGLQLAGGTIRNADGIDAVLALAGVGATGGILVGAQPAAAPSITGVVAGDGVVTLQFAAPAQDGGSPVLDYVVTAQPGGLQLQAAASPAVFTGLRNGTAYRFTVTARTAAGLGAASMASDDVVPMAQQQIQFAPLDAQAFGSTPQVLASASSGLAVSLSSSTPRVCSVAADGRVTLLAAGTCSIDADQPGDAATHAATRVSRSFAVLAVVPGAPRITAVVLAAGSVDVSFQAPAFEGGSAVDSYLLQALPGGQSVRGNGSPLRIDGLPSGIAHRFVVTAFNAAGAGAASLPSDPLTVQGAPAVTGVQVPSVGRYLAGQVLSFAVQFDQGLQVGAAPQLLLRIGSQRRLATLSAVETEVQGSVLRFQYTLQADDRDEDGIEVESLQAAAGSLRNAQGTEARTALANVGATTGVRVGADLPSAAANVRGVAGDGQVQVHFDAASAGSGAIVDYTVTAQPGGISATGTTSPITVRGLANGSAYRFVVVARSEYGSGVASAASAAVVPLPDLAVADSSIVVPYGAAAVVLPLSVGGVAEQVQLTVGPQHGQVDVQGTTLRYTPAAGYAGNDSISYTVSDAFRTSAPATITITVGTPTVVLQSAALPLGVAGTALDAQLASNGGAAPYTYAIVGGSLPTGLRLDRSGHLAGTPVAAGRFEIEVEVTDSSSGSGPFRARRAFVLNVAAPQIEEVEAPLPAATQAGPVSLRLQARGGTAPYAFRLMSGALPPGVLLSSDGQVQGVATVAGVFDFDVEVSDTYGFTGVARYQLKIAQAAQAITGFSVDPATPVYSEGGSFEVSALGGASGQPLRFGSSSPAVCSVSGTRVAMLAAGRCVLTVDQDGDANHEAAAQQLHVVDIALAVPVLAWSADLQRLLEQGSFELPLPTSASPGAFSFHSSDTTVASVEGRTVHVHGEGRAVITAEQAAAGSYAAASVELVLVVNMRPDPTRDPGVTGLLQAQVDASVRFANAQQANIRERLRQVRAGGNADSNTLSVSTGARGPEAASLPLGQAMESERPLLPAGWGTWASGTATYGRGGPTGAGRYDLRSDGLTVGVDRRLGDSALWGVAGSIGRNDSEQDDARTRLQADQRSLALYGLWRGNAHVFVDAVLATGDLRFDLQRWSRDAGAMAVARREGSQWFGSLALGYEQVLSGMRMSGYARLDGSRSTLDAYREHGLGELDLAYGRHVVDSRALAFGLEGSAVESAEARLRPFWSIEYRQALQDRGEATLNYAEWARPQDYRLAMRSYNDDLLSLSAGVDMSIARGWILSLLLGHEQARGSDRSSSVGLRLSNGSR